MKCFVCRREIAGSARLYAQGATHADQAECRKVCLRNGGPRVHGQCDRDANHTGFHYDEARKVAWWGGYGGFHESDARPGPDTDPNVPVLAERGPGESSRPG